MAAVSKDDLLKMSLDELEKLENLVAEARKEKAHALRLDLKSRVEAMVREAGTSLADLFSGFGGSTDDKPKRTSKSAGGEKAPVAPKFKHPENDTITWSGRGKRPKWFASHLASGKPAEDLLIKK